jgi:hypothetical protein
MVVITDSTRKDKKFKATFKNGITTHFGFKGSKTFLDEGDELKKKNYIARHIVNENWNDPYSAGALSRFILWNKPTLTESLADFNRRFKDILKKSEKN